MLYAEVQPVASEEPHQAQANSLREAAQKPLPRLDDSTLGIWRETLAPVFSFIEEIPVNIVEQGAFKFRRARIRLTSEARAASKTPFRLMQDFEASPELYWGQAVVLHGYLTNLDRLSSATDGESEPAWHQGQLKLWNADQSVRFVTQRLPEGMPTGDKRHEPISVIGYLFSVSQGEGKPPEALVATRWVRWLKPTLDLETLANVKDRRIGLSEDEADAYYRTLLHAKLIEDDVLKQQAEAFWTHRQELLKRPRPVFVDLFKTFEEDPEIYRGQPVTLTGTMRKLRQVTVDPLNNYGIETLYEAWVFDQDSQSNPTVVVFTENPADLPQGDEINVPVRVTGFVFKMYGYKSRDEKHPDRLAPMLIAKSVKKLTIADPDPFPTAWVGAGLALLCLGIVLYVWNSYRQDKAFREITQKPDEEEPPRFDNLEQ